MAYLNEARCGHCQTPRKSQNDRNLAPNTPRHNSNNGTPRSPMTQTTSHRSTPLIFRSGHQNLNRAPSFSPIPTARTHSVTEPNEFIDEDRDIRLFTRPETTSHRNDIHAQSPIPFASLSKIAKTRSVENGPILAPKVSNTIQTLEVHIPRFSNAVDSLVEEVGVHQIEESVSEEELVEEEEEGEEEDYIQGLREAKAVYSSRKQPDFVIGRPGDGLTRDVAFRPRNKRDDPLRDGELTFEFWNEEQTRGFWTLTDDKGFRWIVKFFPKGQEYRAWMGIAAGYDAKGLAFPRKRKHISEAQELETQNAVVGDSEGLEDDALRTARSFRKRNIDQVHPYHTEQTNYKRSKYGKKKKTSRRSTQAMAIHLLLCPQQKHNHRRAKLYLGLLQHRDACQARPRHHLIHESCRAALRETRCLQ